MPVASRIRGLDLFDDMMLRPDSSIFGIVMVRKSCVQSVGPFDPRISTLADIDMWLRLLLKYDAAYIPEPRHCFALRRAKPDITTTTPTGEYAASTNSSMH